MNNIDTEILNRLIIGRVEPHIYAFSTQTVPNYLKIGDTYRPIETRLKEWRRYFPNLEKQFTDIAKADEDTFFRDFAIHHFLEADKGKLRLQRGSLKGLPYYSNEFFKDTEVKDVEAAIVDIKDSHSSNSDKYQFYSFDESRIPVDYKWERTEEFEPRPNQQEVIDRFNEAITKGRTNLLMYAVMRFGKSFTSMCCATEVGAKFVVIVSAKADVKAEWKKTVESHKRFEGYAFLDSQSLLQSESAITDKLKDSKIALFLTLQDLQGNAIKSKHREVFASDVDLLLIDETHFGARATEFGRVLDGLSGSERRNELKQYEDNPENFESQVKSLNAKIKIHLSGTPYRILMGSEFTKDDIIAFCQFTDIVEEQEKWNDENINKDEVKEWDNPYYGFPQMVRFAFNPDEASIKKLEELSKQGISSAFNELFKPESISKDTETQKHTKFKHEQEILNLFEVIDGSKSDDNLLSFLDYDKIKAGKMCRHIVCLLPYRASCDALECLIRNNKDKFKNLNDYDIINIAGVEDQRTYKKIETVKERIKRCEGENKKTLTLTVNRMLTGSTVEQWDTMLYLKDTASPQEYDQAVFRLQNQYIKTYKDAQGDVIRYNMKPQTLLVDFDPARMFNMQEQKSQIYNANVEKNGNDKLEERVKRELDISPIVVLNHNKIQQVEAIDILKALSEYSSDRSVADEANIIPVDFSLLDNEAIRAEIDRQAEINSKKGLKVKAVEGIGDDLDVPDVSSQGDTPGGITRPESKKEKDNKIDSIRRKFATYYSRILFFAFLTKTNVNSLSDIISGIDADDNNKRITENLALNKNILELFRLKMNPFILSKLDYKIHNISQLANDTSLQPLNRAQNALKKFGRLSESEIVTPAKVADQMVAILPGESITSDTKILDIAAKQGEFAIAIYKCFGDKIKRNIYSITTSGVAYEFTRKIYEMLEMPIENIFNDFNSYDMIGENKEEIIKKLNDMKFDIIVGNPPYQLSKEGTSDSPIYNLFMNTAFELSNKVVLITPARFLFNAGKTPKEWNNKILNDKHFKVIWHKSNSADVFPYIDIKGGVAVTFRDQNQIFGSLGTYTTFHELNSILQKVISHKGFTSICDIIHPQNKFIVNNLYHDFPQYKKIIGSNGKEKRLTTSIFEQLDVFSEETSGDGTLRILGLTKNIRLYRHISPKYIEPHKNLHKYKVLIPKSNGSGAIGEVLSTPLIGEPLIGYTQSFISIGALETYSEAEAALKYIKSKFARVMLGVLKVTQDNSKEVWKFVPLQDFTDKSDIDWSKSITEIDTQLYAKYGLTEDEIAFIESMIKPMK